ncbi:MAG: hydantoinase/oxoprolinase family protein [Pseudomonadota bacterium]
MVSLSLGADPRDFALFAFGGAGPLHAVDLARELGVPHVLVPARPGLTNALGCVVADFRQDFVHSVNRPLDLLDADMAARILAQHEAEGRRVIAAETAGVETITVTHAAEMQFIGQTHLLRVALPDAAPDRATLQELFEQAYEARFRVSLPEIRPALINLLTSVVGQRPDVDLSTLITRAPAQPGLRRVWFDTGWLDTPVWQREAVPDRLAGPAIVEQMDTTVLLGPGDVARTDADGNLLIEVAP